MAGGAYNANKPSALRRLLSQATSAMEFFHDGELAYTSLTEWGVRKTFPLVSPQIKRWLTHANVLDTGESPAPAVLARTVDTLEAMATAPGAPEVRVHRRVSTEGGKLYLDLCDDTWSSVEVDGNGWRVVADGPRFIRSSMMRPLPTPVRTTSPRDSLIALRKLLNVDANSYLLISAWLLASMRDAGPYPALFSVGELGSAKTAATAIIRSLVDPSRAATRSLPRTERDLFVAATHSHVMAFDNVSVIPDWLSDEFWQLTTGGAYATRRLWTDGEEVVLEAKRPIILNGITAAPVRGDLADRALVVNLERIPEQHRRTQKEIDENFHTDAPRILGALADGLVAGVANLATTQLPRLPRMADFAKWVTACESAFWSTGNIMRVYDAARDTASLSVIEASTVGRAVIALMNKTAQWTGTMSELLTELDRHASDLNRRAKDWPGSVETLARRMDRLAPDLGAIDIEVKRTRTGRRRTLTLVRREGPAP